MRYLIFMGDQSEHMPLGFLLNTVGRLVFEETSRRMQNLDVEVFELGVLWLVDLYPGRPQAEYAKLQRRDQSTFGRYVDKLEAKGFLVRNAVLGDRRAYSLAVTASGKTLLKKGRMQVYAAQEAIVGTYDERLAELTGFLTDVLNSANEDDSAQRKSARQERIACDR